MLIEISNNKYGYSLVVDQLTNNVKGYEVLNLIPGTRRGKNKTETIATSHQYKKGPGHTYQ